MSAVTTKLPGWQKTTTYIAQNASQTRGLAVVQGSGGDDYAAIASTANVVCLGVQGESTINAGDPVSVVELGDAVSVAGAAITAGVFVKCTASGQFIPVTTTGDNIVGQAKSSAALQGDEFLLFVLPSVL